MIFFQVVFEKLLCVPHVQDLSPVSVVVLTLGFLFGLLFDLSLPIVWMNFAIMDKNRTQTENCSNCEYQITDTYMLPLVVITAVYTFVTFVYGFNASRPAQVNDGENVSGKKHGCTLFMQKVFYNEMRMYECRMRSVFNYLLALSIVGLTAYGFALTFTCRKVSVCNSRLWETFSVQALFLFCVILILAVFGFSSAAASRCRAVTKPIIVDPPPPMRTFYDV